MKFIGLSLGNSRAAAIFTTLVLAAAINARATTLSITPIGQTALLGDPVDVSLGVSGLGNASAPSLGAFDIWITFNPLVLSVSSVSFSDNLALASVASDRDWSIDPVPDTLDIWEISFNDPADLDSLQIGDFNLATIHFATIGVGSSPLTIFAFDLGDSIGSPIQADAFGSYVTVRPASQVPEGGPVSAMFYISMAALIGLRVHRLRAEN